MDNDDLGRCNHCGKYVHENGLISVQTPTGEQLWCPDDVLDNQRTEVPIFSSSTYEYNGHYLSKRNG